jgi:hypothetical protein
MATKEQEHQEKWLASLSLEELKKWVRKNSCLCDMAGICNGCQLSDLESLTGVRADDPIDEDKDYGPAELGVALGTVLGLYIHHGVTKKEVLALVGDIHRDITEELRKRQEPEMKH